MKKKVLAIVLTTVLVLSLGLVMAVPAGANPDPGIVGLWHLDESDGTTAADSSGNGYDGTLTNMSPPGCWVSGKFGNALSFDGSDDYVDVGAAVDDTISTALTLEAWIKYSYADRNRSGGIISNDLTWISKKGYDFFLENGKLGIDVSNGTTVGRVLYTMPAPHPTEPVWLHVAATWDGNTVRLYVDGAPVGTPASLSGNYSDPGKATYVGRINTLPSPYHVYAYPFRGLIDEVRIWNEALTAEQIALSASGSVDWLPPVTNADFILKDGTTLPLKFQIFDDSGLPVATMQSVFVEVTDGTDVHRYDLGDGVTNLRWNADECYYIANLKTKDGTWNSGDYVATVGGIVTGSIGFELSPEKGAGRGNSGKP